MIHEEGPVSRKENFENRGDPENRSPRKTLGLLTHVRVRGHLETKTNVTVCWINPFHDDLPGFIHEFIYSKSLNLGAKNPMSPFQAGMNLMAFHLNLR